MYTNEVIGSFDTCCLEQFKLTTAWDTSTIFGLRKDI